MPYFIARRDLGTVDKTLLDRTTYQWSYAHSHGYYLEDEIKLDSTGNIANDCRPAVSGDYVNYAAAQGEMNLYPSRWPADTYKIEYIFTDSDRRYWRARERNRMIRKEYEPIPWESLLVDGLITADRINEIAAEDANSERFAHLALKTPGKIAYTENDRKGFDDRQTAVTPGRYLQRFFPGLPQQCIDKFVATVALASQIPPLTITRDPDEIERIYRNGPTSCMADKNWAYGSPVRVYGSVPGWESDLAVAYLGDLDSATARCVVWPERKLYTRVYGSIDRMKLILESAGYSQVACLTGAKIRLIENDGVFLMPYIDGADHVVPTRCGRYAVIQGDGAKRLSASETNGYVNNGYTGTCEHCGDEFDSDEPADYCPSCDEQRTSCDQCDRTIFMDDDSYSTPDGVICGRCHDDQSQDCEACGESFCWLTEFSRREQDARDRHGVADLCPSCSDDARNGELCRCTSCDEWHRESGDYCADCTPDETDETGDDTDDGETATTMEPAAPATSPDVIQLHEWIPTMDSWSPADPYHLSLVIRYQGTEDTEDIRREPGTIVIVEAFDDLTQRNYLASTMETTVPHITRRLEEMRALYPDNDYRIVRHRGTIPSVIPPGNAVIVPATDGSAVSL